MPDVLTLIGSLRAASCNRALAGAARAAAPPGLRLHLAGLAGIPVFSEDLETRGLPQPVRALADRILAAGALLIVTPEYNFSIPGGLKNALDWLSRDPRQPLRGRPAAVAGATLGTGGTRQAQAAVRHVLHGLGAYCLPLPPLEITRASGKFSQTGQLTDPADRAQLADYLTELASWLPSGPPLTRHRAGQVLPATAAQDRSRAQPDSPRQPAGLEA